MMAQRPEGHPRGTELQCEFDGLTLELRPQDLSHAGVFVVTTAPPALDQERAGTDSGRGNWAALYDAAAKHTYVYMHMSAPAAVAAADRLEPGEEVGLLGCTGSCDGAHLHFEIREGRSPYATPIDPLPELQRWLPAR